MKATTLSAIVGLATVGAALSQAGTVSATNCTDNVRDNITYTWNQTTGKGSITVKPNVTFCKSLYVTKAAWNMTTKNDYPQTLASKEVVTINGTGTYDVSVPATCRQQSDLYYGYGAEAKLPAQLTGMYDDAPIEFFTKVGGTTPTWSLNRTACAETKPAETQNPTPVATEVTATAPTHKDMCDAKDDTYTIPATTGVAYFVDGKATAAGTYNRTSKKTEITAKAASDTYKLSGTAKWTITFTDEACASTPEQKPATPETKPEVQGATTTAPEAIAATGVSPLQALVVALFTGMGAFNVVHYLRRR